MIKEDVIEGIVALPPKLFYGTSMPGCILILNRNKPDNRKKKIIFIYAARDYEEGKVRNKLRDSDTEKIVSAFKDYKDVDGPRYVDISEPEEEVDIQATIDELKKLVEEKDEIQVRVNVSLKELGFMV